MLEANQYPPGFYDPIIKGTIEKLAAAATINDDEEEKEEEVEKRKKSLREVLGLVEVN